MSDEVEITHGGVIAVDSDALRAVGNRIRYASVAVELAQQDLLAIPGILSASAGLPTPALWSGTAQLSTTGEGLDVLASTTGTVADVYELAELRAEQHLLSATDPQRAPELQRRIDELLLRNPGVLPLEEQLRSEWEAGRVEGFVPASPGTAPLMPGDTAMNILAVTSPVLFGLLRSVGLAGQGNTALIRDLMQHVASKRGVVPAMTPLTPTPGAAVMAGSPRPGLPFLGYGPRPGDVVLTKNTPAPVPAAPTTLGQAVARVPYGDQAQVRVETYELGDGSKRFVAYVDGTRPGRPPTEPWDMASNAAAYLDHAESDSYKAVVAALKDAGADASTPVDLVGYSQGGMITDLIAQSGDFDVQGVFTVGSPIEPELPADVLDVAVRHTDDPVAGLAGGGSPHGTGSPDSLVITRTAVPGHGVDLSLPAHQLAQYQETVRLAEQSGDERMHTIRAHFAALAGATTMTSTDYTATRVLPDE